MRNSIPILMSLLLLSACGAANPTRSIEPTIQVVIASPTAIRSDTPIPLPTSTPTSLPAKIMILDDFEAPETAWLAGTADYFTDSSATSLALTHENVPVGSQALQLNFESNSLPKAIFFLDKQLDLSQGKSLKFDLFNPGSINSIGIAMLTGPDKVWAESDGNSTPSGKQSTISFDLTAATYKTEATNWEFRASIGDLTNVSRLAIIVYPAKTGSIIIDNIRISDAP